MGSDEDRFYALVDKLVATKMTKTEVVQLLGYAGNPGANFEAVVAGKCKKYTLTEAIELLEGELKKRGQTKVPPQKDEDRFYAFVDKLVATKMTKTEVVQLLGYAGNPGANFEAVVAGKCKKYTLTEAIELLEAELKKKRGQTKVPSQQKAAAAADSSSSDPKPDDGAASAAGAPAGADEARFYALVDKLVATKMTRTEVVQLLGYKANPGANFEAVVAGKCKKYTLTEAIKLLEAELKKKRGEPSAPSQKGSSGVAQKEKK